MSFQPSPFFDFFFHATAMIQRLSTAFVGTGDFILVILAREQLSPCEYENSPVKRGHGILR